VTFAAQRAGQAIASVASLPVQQRLANASSAYIAYLGKIFWPARLSVFYPLAEPSQPGWQPLAAVVFLLCATAFVVALRRRAAYLATGWFWFLGTLVPVIGLVQIGSQSMADRYTYVPAVGIFVACVWAVSDLTGHLSFRVRTSVAALTAIMLVACTGLTWKQVQTWHSPVALWQHALDVMPNNYRAKAHLGQQCLERGQFDEARRYATGSLDDRPSAVAHLVLGLLEFKDGKLDDATTHYEQALSLESSGWSAAWNGLGAVQAARGDFARAESSFRQSLALDRYSSTAHNNLGLALLNQGQFNHAAGWFQGAVNLDPRYAAAYENLAIAHAAEEKWTDALSACAAAVDLESNQPRHRRLLACLLWELRDIDEGKRQYQVADHLDTDWQQRQGEEVQQLLESSAASPYTSKKALLLAKQVCEASHPAPQAADLLLLARAYAATGQDDKASVTAQRALRAAEATGDADLAAEIRARLTEDRGAVD
jgi:tetratricopeptide (TPR) repeat protein